MVKYVYNSSKPSGIIVSVEQIDGSDVHDTPCLFRSNSSSYICAASVHQQSVPAQAVAFHQSFPCTALQEHFVAQDWLLAEDMPVEVAPPPGASSSGRVRTAPRDYEAAFPALPGSEVIVKSTATIAARGRPMLGDGTVAEAARRYEESISRSENLGRLASRRDEALLPSIHAARGSVQAQGTVGLSHAALPRGASPTQTIAALNTTIEQMKQRRFEIRLEQLNVKRSTKQVRNAKGHMETVQCWVPRGPYETMKGVGRGSETIMPPPTKALVFRPGWGADDPMMSRAQGQLDTAIYINSVDGYPYVAYVHRDMPGVKGTTHECIDIDAYNAYLVGANQCAFERVDEMERRRQLCAAEQRLDPARVVGIGARRPTTPPRRAILKVGPGASQPLRGPVAPQHPPPQLGPVAPQHLPPQLGPVAPQHRPPQLGPAPPQHLPPQLGPVAPQHPAPQQLRSVGRPPVPPIPIPKAKRHAVWWPLPEGWPSSDSSVGFSHAAEGGQQTGWAPQLFPKGQEQPARQVFIAEQRPPSPPPAVTLPLHNEHLDSGVSHAATGSTPLADAALLQTPSASISQLPPSGAYSLMLRSGGIVGMGGDFAFEPWQPRPAPTRAFIEFAPTVSVRGDITADVSSLSALTAAQIAASQVSMFGPEQLKRTATMGKLVPQYLAQFGRQAASAGIVVAGDFQSWRVFPITA